MSVITTSYAEIYEDSPALFLARVVGADGSYITQASLTSIDYEVWDRDSASTSASTGTVTIATSVFDDLQTSNTNVWTTDDVGYNFSHTMGTNVMSTAGHRYLVQYNITPASGGSYPLQFEVVTRKRW